MESQPQNPEFRKNPKNFHPCAEADFLWKVSLKILNSGKILKTFTYVLTTQLTSKAGHLQPASKITFQWHFAGGQYKISIKLLCFYLVQHLLN